MKEFETYLQRWALEPDGRPFRTPSSRLLPVRAGGVPAMLKLATVEEERLGADLMVWWRGGGAARVLARDGAALLIERATAGKSLATLVRDGGDDAACRIACRVAAALHAPRRRAPPERLVPLDVRFRALWPASARHGEPFASCAAVARGLLAEPREVGVLHGDIHHDNILDFGAGRGWRAIDPKGLLGERGYDFANLFCNPDPASAADPERLARRLGVIAGAAGLDPDRLLRWVIAHAGLSAAWHVEDGGDPGPALAVAGNALRLAREAG